ncbi:MAG: tetratricopeptide repeat protein [Flavisolibacter sp.]
MNRPQWITIAIACLLVIGLYAATQKQLFGERKRKAMPAQASAMPASLSIDTILFHAKESLPKEQVSYLSQLENSISRGDVANQKIHLYHQLASFWKDSAKAFAPFAWYTAEEARLENSEKSLTFAARLFLEGLKNEEDIQLKQWEALQAKDLFERSLKLNPANDSSKVSLGAVYLYGGIASPMEGIQLIRGVADKDSANIYAQMTLGEASLVSGQMEKAIERFSTVVRLQPGNLEAIFRIAETYEQMHNHAEAIAWYQKSLPFIKVAGLKQEVEKRMDQLKK